MTVFDVFMQTGYTFLKISRGGVTGNSILSQSSAMGVFKLRSDMVRGSNSETIDSASTLHIKPSESFLSDNGDNLVGHGVRINGRDYEIIGQTGGMNYHTGEMEHYTATLQPTDFSGFGGDNESS